MLSRDKYFIGLAEKGTRDDGRKPDEFRNIEIQTGIIEKAEGSALVKMGATQILVGIKMDVKTPFPDTPNEGVLMAGAELSPIASPLFESSPPATSRMPRRPTAAPTLAAGCPPATAASGSRRWSTRRAGP